MDRHHANGVGLLRNSHILLGIIGGTLGVAAAMATFLSDNVGYAVMNRDAAEVQRLGMVAAGFSLAGMFGSIIASRRRGLGIGALIFSAAGGLLAISFYFLLPAVLFTTAAISVPRQATPASDPAAPALRTAVDCPRCQTRFAIPMTRPLRIQCPSCGASGKIGDPAPAPSAVPARPVSTPAPMAATRPSRTRGRPS